jgi:hypothetical protein
VGDSMNRKIITVGKAKELGIWSEVCNREQWNEEFLNEIGLSDEARISVDADLLS